MFDVIQYIKGVYAEYKFIVWPKYAEIVSACILVMILSVLFGCFLFAVDFVMMKVFSFLFFN